MIAFVKKFFEDCHVEFLSLPHLLLVECVCELDSDLFEIRVLYEVIDIHPAKVNQLVYDNIKYKTKTHEIIKSKFYLKIKNEKLYKI